MKKKIIFILSITFFVLTAFAQTGNWNLAGNTLNGTQKLGSINSSDLRIFTNNIQRFTIKGSNGRVGIGTSAPENTFHIFKGSAGTVTGDANAPLIVENSTHSYINLLAPDASETGILFGKPQHAASGSIIYNNSSNLNGLQFRTNGNVTRMVLNNNGNLGINTLNPSHAKLEINGNIGAAVAMFGADKYGVTIEADNPEIGFNYFYNGGTKTIKAGYAAYMGMTPSNGDIYIGNFNGNQSSSNFGSITGAQTVMTINQNGSVGVLTYPASNWALTVNPDPAPAQMEGLLARGNEFGVWAYSRSYGVFGNGDYAGIYGEGGQYAGYFSGNVYSSGGYTTSDQKLKKNIRDFTSAMDIINKLKPKQFEFRQDGNYKLMNLPQGSHFGLIAQDVEKILPHLVNDTKFETAMAQSHVTKAVLQQAQESGKTNPKPEVIEFKALNYTELIPIIIKGIQEQQQMIDNLQQQNEKQQEQIDRLEQIITKLTSSSQSSVNGSAAYLEQNAPNPFNQNTLIKYFLPQNIDAAINITDINGKIIKTIVVTGKGSGQLILDAQQLAAGTYQYSLIVNGKVIDTKKMVLTR